MVNVCRMFSAEELGIRAPRLDLDCEAFKSCDSGCRGFAGRCVPAPAGGSGGLPKPNALPSGTSLPKSRPFPSMTLTQDYQILEREREAGSMSRDKRLPCQSLAVSEPWIY